MACWYPREIFVDFGHLDLWVGLEKLCHFLRIGGLNGKVQLLRQVVLQIKKKPLVVKLFKKKLRRSHKDFCHFCIDGKLLS